MVKTRSHSREKGQSLVEFSLTLGIALLILAGIMDLGRAYHVFIALEDAAGEAAMFLALSPECAGPPEDGYPPECAEPNNADFRARNATRSGEIDWSTVTITPVTFFSGVADNVQIEVSYRFELVTPIITRIVGSDGIVLTASASQLILTEKFFGS